MRVPLSLSSRVSGLLQLLQSTYLYDEGCWVMLHNALKSPSNV